MFKKNGGKIVAALAILLVGGLLLAGTVPAFAAGYGFGNGNGKGMGTGMGRNGNSLASIASDVLGMTRSDLAAERQAGKTLVDIAAEKGIEKDQLVESVLAKRQTNLEQALKDNKITEEQYNQCVQQMKENIEKNLTRSDTGPNGQDNGNNMRGKGQGLKNSAGQGRGANCNGNASGVCGNCQRQ